MITAKQAFESYNKWRDYSPTEKFVYSVMQEIITDDLIKRRSTQTTELRFSTDTIIDRIFVTEDVKGFPVIVRWKIGYSKVPEEIAGKRKHELLDELERMYKNGEETSFICRAFNALVRELEIVRGFKVAIDSNGYTFTISWDLKDTKNT